MKNLQHKVEQGMSPTQFVEAMTKNQTQFKEWINQFQFQNEADDAFFHSFHNQSQLNCLIVAADWCGDVVRNVPVVFQLMSAAEIPTKVLIMEEHLDVIDQFLTFGGRSIPKVLFLNEQGDVVGERAHGRPIFKNRWPRLKRSLQTNQAPNMKKT